jgi:hypothetical protein
LRERNLPPFACPVFLPAFVFRSEDENGSRNIYIFPASEPELIILFSIRKGAIIMSRVERTLNLLVFCFAAVAVLAACGGGKSDITGEVIPIERVCNYKRAEPVAVEGFLAPETMRCERASNRKASGITGCTFDVYAESDRKGAKIPVFISTGGGWFGGKYNRIIDPAGYTGNMQFSDGRGNPLPKKDLQIYDNDGNLIASGSKIRVYSRLPNSESCEFRLAERIEQVTSERKAQKSGAEQFRYVRNMPVESF